MVAARLSLPLGSLHAAPDWTLTVTSTCLGEHGNRPIGTTSDYGAFCESPPRDPESWSIFERLVGFIDPVACGDGHGDGDGDGGKLGPGPTWSPRRGEFVAWLDIVESVPQMTGMRFVHSWWLNRTCCWFCWKSNIFNRACSQISCLRGTTSQ